MELYSVALPRLHRKLKLEEEVPTISSTSSASLTTHCETGGIDYAYLPQLSQGTLTLEGSYGSLPPSPPPPPTAATRKETTGVTMRQEIFTGSPYSNRNRHACRDSNIHQAAYFHGDSIF